MRKILPPFCIMMCVFITNINAHIFDPTKSGKTTQVSVEEKTTSAGCLPPSTSAELNVNNVRTLIHSGGDMWWDLVQNARYEIPKGSGRHSLYVGNLWIGGREAQTQTLKVAAQRYRSNGVDFWTGPLDSLGTASIDAETCDLYDQLWSISRQEVEKFRLCWDGNSVDPNCDNYQVPESIKKWPGNPIFQSNEQHKLMQHVLAPYFDNDSNGYYDYTKGDYPLYDLDNTIDCNADRSALLYGDFTLWWVFNDKGNIHGETQGNAIGMEIRAQAFGFTTNDEINNMTFYNYQLINRGTTTLEQCYFGVNTDADIGGAKDDYTGCDVERGFGYMYNADDYDEPYSGANGYGENPPAIGIDFFLGPYLDSNGVADFWDKSWTPATAPQFARDAITNLEDSSRVSIAYGINGVGFDDQIVDNERYGMRRFVYYNNGEDPVNGSDYYNLLRGVWTQNAGGSRMIYGGTGKPVGAFAGAPYADFMFPGGTDPWNWGTKGIDTDFPWSETNTGGTPATNPANDRRFVQSAGPFTLKPGAVNDITTGVVWARTSSGDADESVLKVLAADIKAQSLFENCFRVLEGPRAPDLNIQELDEELVMYLTNKPGTNNYLNKYEELNYFIPEFGLTPVSKDTNIWLPQYDSTIVAGDTYYLYQQERPNAYDSLFIWYAGVTPIDTLFGYLTNQSTLTTISIQTGELDTSYFDRMIRFEGYLIYQVKDKTVTATDVFGPKGSEFGRLVAQCDIKNFDANGNPIGRLVNFEFDDALGFSIPKVKVDGANEGIRHSFKITRDEFSLTSNKNLVNHKEYYYMALAYGYNNYKTYNPDDPYALDGQKEPFFLGRTNIKTYTGVPHITTPENGGTVLNSLYGFGPQITRIEGRGNGGNILELTKETEDEILSSPDFKANKITYENGLGPVQIKIIDPLSIEGKKYLLKVLDPTPANIKTVRDTATWVLLDPSTPAGEDDTVAISDTDISQPYEQIIYDRRDGKFLGFSINISQVPRLGPTWTYNGGALNVKYIEPTTVDINGTQQSTPGNGLLYTSINFENSENAYLGFFQDLDGSNPLNYARSGSLDDADVYYWNSNYFQQNQGGNNPPLRVFFDPQGKYISGASFNGAGGLVPYILTSPLNSYNGLPGHGIANTRADVLEDSGRINNSAFADYIGSVDIVITPDKTKWSRCPVFETHNKFTGSSFAYRDPGFPLDTFPQCYDLRFSFSVDKEGNKTYATSGSNNPDSANFISPYGMGWFPGYAIDIETGERLNIAFGEDSYLGGENGRDMLFNPSSSNPLTGSNEGYYTPLGDYLLAGKHYIYVFQSNRNFGGSIPFPNYDHGQELMNQLTDATNNGYPLVAVNTTRAKNIWRNCIWAGVPYNVTGKTWLGGEVRIKLRVQKPYQKDYSASNAESAPVNNNNPLYEFSFDGLQTITHQNSSATSALDIIQVVPNPYYSASEYETSAIENKVKIVNLPDECDISIYTLNGTLIRKYVKRDKTTTSVSWDLKNFKNIPISTGLYIIHVNAPGIGEKILKWYGVMRPMQLDNF